MSLIRDFKIIANGERLVSASTQPGQAQSVLCACVWRFSKCESSHNWMQPCDFRRRYGIDEPTARSIRRWYNELKELGCPCKEKSATGRPRVPDDNAEIISF